MTSGYTNIGIRKLRFMILAHLLYFIKERDTIRKKKLFVTFYILLKTCDNMDEIKINRAAEALLALLSKLSIKISFDNEEIKSRLIFLFIENEQLIKGWDYQIFFKWSVHSY